LVVVFGAFIVIAISNVSREQHVYTLKQAFGENRSSGRDFHITSMTGLE
jgi:hypothetical protein